MNEETIKHKVLIDNTAQSIFNALEKIENEREIYDKRWIWELLQNALDSVPEGRKIRIKIINKDNRLTFIHNGRPFNPEEVAHLIYHGSTKKELYIGKFGTGFLTTHLLSRKVSVEGVRDDRKKFKFVLNREGASSEEIKSRMEETWRQYTKSLINTETALDYTVKFEYSLDDVSSHTVKVGIEDLTIIAPHVLAFNDRIETIMLTDETHTIKFELVENSNETVCITKVVKEEREGVPPIFHDLWIVRGNEVEIAVKGKKQTNGICQMDSLQGIPRIFLAFPLFGTQDLPFPAVVNSRKFKPRDERDGIFLGIEETDDIKQNKKLLREASELFIKLVSDSDSNKWENIHVLLNLYTPPQKDWLDREWYIDLLKGFVNKIINERILKAKNGNFISVKEGFIPLVDGVEESKLWDLCSSFSAYEDKIPAKELAIEWSRIIGEWKSLGLDLADREITIEKLAEDIEGCGNLQSFKTILENGKDELGTLNDFYKILLNAGKNTLFDNKNILPNQNGVLKKKSELFKDEGIDEPLKNISNKLGKDVRSLLLHSKISDDVQNLVSAKKQDEVLNQIVNIIKQPRSDDNQYLEANIELFSWLLEHNKLEHLEGYPLLSAKEKAFILLGKERKEKPLAPKNVWNEKARNCDELFPQDLIISSLYHEKILRKNKWDKLENEGLILTDPLYKEMEKGFYGDLDLLLLCDEKLDQEKEHDVVDDVEVSQIAFLETKDKGIIDTIRKSKDKCRKFLAFIFEYVIEVDDQWRIPLEVNCSCGKKHKIYPSLWMARLRDRLWIPVSKDKSEKPSAQYLASLLEDHKELLQSCREDKPSRLLSILNVSISELMMRVVAKNPEIRLELEKAMGSLYSTFMTNPFQLNKIAQLAESEPEFFVKKIEEQMQNMEKIRKNQSVGRVVENLLKNVFEKEGFKIEKTGTGSDFIIEHDLIEDGIEMIYSIRKENISYLIEVKSTSQDYVKMTLKQAETANEQHERYLLCVIKLSGAEINEDIIKKNARFVTDIGKKIEDKVSKVKKFREKAVDALSISEDVEIEISEGQIRFKINEHVWETGRTFDTLPQYF